MIAVVAGCTGSPRQPATSSRGTPGSAIAAASPVRLPALVLRADLSERPFPWDPVALVPFGKHPGQLGFKAFHEGPASQPSALAVAQDGSLWIDDRWKRRVAHYSPAGRYLAEAGPVEAGRGWDLAVQGDGVFVLVEQETGVIGTVHGHAVMQN